MKNLWVYVVSGFLGSGKSTFLNRLIRENPKLNAGFILNEYGTVALESQILEAPPRGIVELPSGCLCCVPTSDLEKALSQLRQKAPHLERIFIESSGLTETAPLLRRLFLLQEKGDFTYGGTFCLVDSQSYLTRNTQFELVSQQLSLADRVFLSKTDLVTPEELSAVRHRVETDRPGLPIAILPGPVDWNLLLSQEGILTPLDGEDQDHGEHSQISRLEYSTRKPLDPVALGKVLHSLPQGVIRGKGVLFLDEPSAKNFKYLYQYTGYQSQLFSRPWGMGDTRESHILMLGQNVDWDRVKEQLEACRA